MSAPAGRLRLPHLLREFADVAGEPAALKLAQAHGGTRIYVARKIDEGHWLAQLLGLQAAKALSKLYAGEEVMIPLGMNGVLHNARQTARQALDDGATVAQAARAAGLTERTVWRLLSQEERVRTSGQGNLFDQ